MSTTRVCPSCGTILDLATCPIVSTASRVGASVNASARRGPRKPDLGGADFSALALEDEDEPRPISAGLLLVPTVTKQGSRFDVLWRPSDDARAQPVKQGWFDQLVAVRQAHVSSLKSLDEFPTAVLARRLCLTCDVPLPPDSDTRPVHIVAVVGLNQAGKTNFLASALFSCLRERGLRPSGCTEFSPDVETAGIYQQKYYAPLFGDDQVLAPTYVDEKVRRDRLAFKVTYPQYQPFLMVTHDISGEQIMDWQARAQSLEFLRSASAVIFAVDPTEFRSQRRQMPREQLLKMRDMDQSDLLEATLDELRFAPGNRKVPVALTITKSDLLDPLVDPTSKFLRPPTGDWLDDVKKTSDEIRNMLVDMGEVSLVDKADAYCAGDPGSVSYHAVSALGGGPDHVAAAGVTPRRCADPFASVLLRLVSRLQ